MNVLYYLKPQFNTVLKSTGYIFSIFALASCESSIDPDDFFPLQNNTQWIYSGYQNNWRLTDSDFIHIVRNIEYHEDKNGILLKRTRQDKNELIYRIDESGVYFFFFFDGSMEDSGELIFPFPPDKNKKWTRKIKTRFIPEFACGYCTSTDTLKHPLVVEFSVIKINANIKTPAGKFKNCVVIEGIGKAEIDAGDSMGNVNVELHIREWYAPGVGLVKLEWREQTDQDILMTGDYRLELKDIYYNQ